MALWIDGAVGLFDTPEITPLSYVGNVECVASLERLDNGASITERAFAQAKKSHPLFLLELYHGQLAHLKTLR